MAQRKRIVILGGGLGALSAACHLSSDPGWNERYDLTVYQMGWRLGGKCASSRDAEHSLRIEEHGLHVWFGFYENAFRMLRDCYRELGEAGQRPFRSVDEAFRPVSLVSMLEQSGAGAEAPWSRWTVPFRQPLLPGRPGTDEGVEDDLHALGHWDIPQRLLGRLLEALEEPQLAAHTRSPLGKLRQLLALVEGHKLGGVIEEAAVDLVIAELHMLRTVLQACLGAGSLALPALRRTWEFADLALTVLIGLLRDDLYHRGLASIDHLDLREWLRHHGAGQATVDSVLLRALYDCCFAYRDGRIEQPDFAAGAALGCALRIGLMWRGSVFYLMNAGMGDLVVAPLYEMLRRRGVQFEFFHQVKKLELDPARRRIARIRFGRQATVRPECASYDPLLRSDKLPYPVWPDQPRLEQLVEGAALKGVDLESHWSQWPEVEAWSLELNPQDQVVLGISLGALEPIGAELAAADAGWERLLRELPSMQTQAAQLWFDPPTAQMGWASPDHADDRTPVMVAAPELMDVWADMSHGLEQEPWPEPRPRSLLYFCGPLPGDLLHGSDARDPSIPGKALDQVRAGMRRWLDTHTRTLAPGAALPGGAGLDWSLLHDAGGAIGPARLEAQYLRANIDPGERYVLSPKNANSSRLAPDRSGFDNLVLAGDWTRTAINAGCVEAAVMSGMAASRALCGDPRRIHGEGFLQGTPCRPAAPVKVAVLGGGCGALSAAYWLSSTEDLRRRYQVTVYTPGWRLGGKGASGRDEAQHQRILEHGLHLMMGFYETVFQVLRDCYASMDKPPHAAFNDWHEAFEEQYRITLWRKPAAGAAAEPWNLEFPDRPGLPGDGSPLLGEDAHGVAELAHRLLHWLTHPGAAERASAGLLQRLLDRVRAHLPGHAAPASPSDALLRRLGEHAARAPADYLAQHWDALGQDLCDYHGQIQHGADPFGRGLFDGGWHHDLVLANLAVAGLRGLIADVLPHGLAGFARIDHLDFKDWLQGHGAWQEAVEDPLVMCLYDLAFAYKDGDSSTPQQGQAAAGAFLRLILRMALTYKGAPLWKMRAGMGDAIFTPLYRTLRQRGVRFEFFHRATGLEVSADGRCIAGIALQRQALLKGDEYQPLRRVCTADNRCWDCWPSEPQWDQLENGAALRDGRVDFEDPWNPLHAATRRLEPGRDYDAVVLGIPPAAAAPITRQLAQANAGWKAMLDHTASVATLSGQLWLKPDLQQLGWPHGVTVSTTYADPLRSWGEMSHLLVMESWPAAAAPLSCHYLCGTFQPAAPPPAPGLAATGYIDAQNQAVEQTGRAWLATHAQTLWPRSCADACFDWQHCAGVYWRANVAPSELYVQSLPGTTRYRLDPGGSGFDNLFLAGDWTRTSINGGCAEAAFESGLLAARALMERELS